MERKLINVNKENLKARLRHNLENRYRLKQNIPNFTRNRPNFNAELVKTSERNVKRKAKSKPRNTRIIIDTSIHSANNPMSNKVIRRIASPVPSVATNTRKKMSQHVSG
jgi:hypothetical protein